MKPEMTDPVDEAIRMVGAAMAQEPFRDRESVIADRLRNLRNQRRLSVEQVAQMANCSVNDVRALERGIIYRRFGLLLDVGIVLYTSANYLLCGIGHPNDRPHGMIELLYGGTPKARKLRMATAQLRMSFIADGRWNGNQHRLE